MQLRAHRQAGFMLTEVLVAMLLSALAVVALAGLHARALQASRMGQHQVVAMQLVADLAERLRANRAGAQPGAGGASAYQLESSWEAQQSKAAASALPACDSAGTACSATEFAQADLAQWRILVARALPSGAAWVQVDGGAGLADIWVAWADALPARADESPAAAGQCPAGLAVEPGTGIRCMHARVAW